MSVRSVIYNRRPQVSWYSTELHKITIRSVSVYFWDVLSNASNSQGIQEQAQSALHLLPSSLCPSIFLYHLVTCIFKLSTVSVRLRQTYAYILFLACVFLEAHPSTYFCQADIYSARSTNRCTSLYSSGCLRRLSSRVPRWQENLLTLGRQPESQRWHSKQPYYVNKHGRNTRAHPHARKTDRNWEWCF